MANILVVLAHPRPGSFNHAIARSSVQALGALEHTVMFHDLVAERFEPVLPAGELEKDAPLEPWLARQCRELATADGMVVVHPNWWGQPPAILR